MASTSSELNVVGGPPTLAADGPIGYALLRAAKAHKALATTRLRAIGLYPGQELVLMHLWDRDERTQSELVRALNLDASTVTRMVARLAEQEVVRLQPSQVDGRAVIVSLTPRGRKLCPEVGRIWAELEATTTRGMSERQREHLLSALRRLTKGLTAGDT